MKITKGTPYWRVAKSADLTKWEDFFLFHCKVEKLPPPVQQFKFAQGIGRKWRTDFAWPRERIIVEIEGGIWRKSPMGGWGGAHTHPLNVLRDIEKYNHMAMLGYRLFRFSYRELKSRSAFEMLKRVFSGG